MSKREVPVCLLAIVALLSVSVFPAALALQDESPTWLRVLSGPSYGALFGAVPIGESHAIAVGATSHTHTPPYRGDVLIVKVDLQNGELIWEKTWGGDGYEQAWAIAPAADDGFYLFGETDSHGAGDRDFFLLRTDAGGEQIWFRTYGTPDREWPFGMLPLVNGDLLMYGEIRTENGSEDPYAVRVDREGAVVWEYRDREDGANVFFLDAIETAEGRIVLCTAIDEDGALTALDGDGRRAWIRRYELDGWQYASAIEATADGYLLTGFWMTESESTRQADVWLAATSLSGELEWHRSFGDPEADDYGMDMVPVAGGGYLIAGLGRGLPLWKVSDSGDVLWERRLEGATPYAAGTVANLEDGGFLVPGLEILMAARSSDAVLIRVDAEGRLAEGRQ